MTYNKLLLEGQKKLKERGLDQSLAKTFLMESASLTANSFYSSLSESPSLKVIKKYNKYLNSYISKNKPSQYLLKKAYFYNLEFIVNKHTLIPRPETEGIIELLKSHLNEKENLNILDVGTGSGVISVTLSKLFPSNNYFAVDKSLKALKIAKKNNRKHNTNVKMFKSDLFNKVNNKLDIVVANLPYVSTTEELDNYVLKEPKTALFAGIDGVDLYDNFFKQVFKYVNFNYLIIIEHGYLQKELLKEIIKKYNDKTIIETFKDLNGKDRYTIVRGLNDEKFS